ncbi:MAG: hypothetical protein NFW16_18790, partial [Candidatus Accumulibacter sp.]|uniref:hypothetical protein n=1 Tax=Accumulibacter sp. TaxID=2053492 RepID=UPI00258D21D7
LVWLDLHSPWLGLLSSYDSCKWKTDPDPLKGEKTSLTMTSRCKERKKDGKRVENSKPIERVYVPHRLWSIVNC